MGKKRAICWAVTFPCDAEGCFCASLRSGLFPGVGFMVMGSACLCRRLVVEWQVETPASRGTSPLGIGQTFQNLQLWIRTTLSE